MGRIQLRAVLRPALTAAHLLVTFIAGAELPETPPADTPRSEAPTAAAAGGRDPGVCRDEVGYGPIRVSSQSPFQLPRPGPVPRMPSTLARGQAEASARLTWANLWAHDDGRYLVDAETLRAETTLAYGLTDSLQLEVGLETKARFGGILDGPIQEFQDILHVDHEGRDEAPKNRFRTELHPDGGTPVVLDGDDAGICERALRLTLQHDVTCGSESLPALAYAVSIRGDLGATPDLDDRNPVDVAVSLSASKRLGDLYGYIGLGAAWFGAESFGGLDLRPIQLSALLAVEWRLLPEMSVLLQYLVSQGMTKDLGPFSRPSHEILVGWKGEVAPGLIVELGLLENLFVIDSSPDFGIHAGILQRF